MHIINSANEVENASGETQGKAQRQLDFLNDIVNSPPQCDILNTNVLPTAAACRQVLKTPFSSFSQAQRFAIWLDGGSNGDSNTPPRRPNCTLSHLVSLFEASSKVLDLQYEQVSCTIIDISLTSS